MLEWPPVDLLGYYILFFVPIRIEYFLQVISPTRKEFKAGFMPYLGECIINTCRLLKVGKEETLHMLLESLVVSVKVCTHVSLFKRF